MSDLFRATGFLSFSRRKLATILISIFVNADSVFFHWILRRWCQFTMNFFFRSFLSTIKVDLDFMISRGSCVLLASKRHNEGCAERDGLVPWPPIIASCLPACVSVLPALRSSRLLRRVCHGNLHHRCRAQLELVRLSIFFVRYLCQVLLFLLLPSLRGRCGPRELVPRS